MKEFLDNYNYCCSWVLVDFPIDYVLGGKGQGKYPVDMDRKFTEDISCFIESRHLNFHE